MAEFEVKSERVKSFLREPLDVTFQSLTVDDLKQLVQYWGGDVTHGLKKSVLLEMARELAVEQGIPTEVVGLLPVSKGVSSTLELEMMKLKMHNDLELEKQRQELAFRRELEFEKLKGELAIKERASERAADDSLALERERWRDASPPPFDMRRNLCILPKFSEKDLDTFFVLFERLAQSRKWPEEEQVVMLQSVLIGKAQEAYSSISPDQALSYKAVKEAVLKAYELVPEAYRLKFRTWKLQDKQSHVEFAREMMLHFSRWRNASEAHDYESLCNLITLEQFKNSVSESVSTYITERKARTASEAAILADEYVLIRKVVHKDRSLSDYRGSDPQRHDVRFRPSKPSQFVPSRGNSPLPMRDVAGTDGRLDRTRICHVCRLRGHWRNECPRSSYVRGPKPVGLLARSCQSLSPTLSQSVSEMSKQLYDYTPFITNGLVHLGDGLEKHVKVLRDTGASQSLILSNVLKFGPDSYTGSSVLIRSVTGHLTIPLHTVILTSELVSGEVVLGVCTEFPMTGVSLILGNDLAGPRVTKPSALPVVVDNPMVFKEPDVAGLEFPEVFTSCAVTRAMAKKNMLDDKRVPHVDSAQCDLSDTFFSDFETLCQPDHVTIINPVKEDVVGEEDVNNLDIGPSVESGREVPPAFDTLLNVSRDKLIDEQQADPTLRSLFDLVVPEAGLPKLQSGYFLQGGLLCRKWVFKAESYTNNVIQVVVPYKFRKAVLQVSHNEVAGHTGVRKTYDRVMRSFFWPNLKRDVALYVRTCHTCQITGKPNQRIPVAPLRPISAISPPFHHLVVDCVGPLPRSKAGHCYLLTVMCQSTRYPEAFPLRSITTRSVLKALTSFMSTFGIAKVIQTDQGSNFMSRQFAKALKQLKARHNISSAYHPQSQGALERFHQTLKSLLRSYCTELGGDWEEGLPWLLLAIREVVQESTGFSPNELVFGHVVRGPAAVLADEWRKEKPPENVLDYVSGFRYRLYQARAVALKVLEKSQKKMQRLYDKKAVSRSFVPGDQVLALLPLPNSPFQAKFSGPYSVERCLSNENYLIGTPDRRKNFQLCHINLLKAYYPPSTSTVTSMPNSSSCVETVGLIAPVVPVPDPVLPFLSEKGEEDAQIPEGYLFQGRLENSAYLKTIETQLEYLTEEQRSDLISLIQSHLALFPDTPTRTNVISHDIDVGNATPIKQRFYRVSLPKQKHLDSEVDYMVRNGIARPAFSEWSSPCLLVAKTAELQRFCTDFRKVNAVTKSDCFPLPRMEDCVDKVGSAVYVTKLDLLKGFWQVPLTPRAQEISSFITPTGLYSYLVMPFGLKNAPSTFQRLMNRVLSGLEGCAAYLDDVVVCGDTWPQHVQRLEALFDRLAQATLTVNLAKCEFAKATVTYLGKVVGQGQVKPVMAKVVAIEAFPIPTSKKELLRFLGMVGYYRGFCNNFSTVAAPLTDLLQAKNPFYWSKDCETAFNATKALLCNAPVLAAPRFDRQFTLQVDASGVGAGAVLLQPDEDGLEHPVGYFSRKFNACQCRYAVIEQEALALIWALQHFAVYVGSVPGPLVIYTDHNPLTFLKSMMNPNQRLMRWSLFLQAYDLRIKHIKGTANVLADALSRAPV